MRGHVFAPTTADARVPTSLVRRAESSANPLHVAAGVRPVASTEDAASDLWRASAAPAVQRNGSSRLWVDAAAGLARSGGHQGFPPASISETVLIQSAFRTARSQTNTCPIARREADLDTALGTYKAECRPVFPLSIGCVSSTAGNADEETDWVCQRPAAFACPTLIRPLAWRFQSR